jgi:hypothetical protein
MRQVLDSRGTGVAHRAPRARGIPCRVLSRRGIALAASAALASLVGCSSAANPDRGGLHSHSLDRQGGWPTVERASFAQRDIAAGTIPTPSQTQATRAIRLLHTSRALTRLLNGIRYRIAHKGPWTTGGNRNRLLGVVFWLELAHTTDIAGTWPTTVYEPKSFPPYRQQSESFKAFGVGVLFVEVDLVRGRVAGVTPSPPQPEHPESVGGPTTIPVEPPSAVARTGGRQLAEFYFGRAVTAQSGCLACHRIGQAGNNGPGPDVSHVGSRLSASRIERAILKPTAPMPSFRYLPKAKLRAVVTFLSLLRG